MRRFCVSCGKIDDGTVPFIGSLCLDCYVKLNKLLCVPEKIEFEYCRFCGAVRIGYRWVEGGELYEASAKYAAEVLAKVKPCKPEVKSYELISLKPITEPSWLTTYQATYSIKLKDVDNVVEQTYVVKVKAIPSICPSCHMARGGDYNVLVQIRGRLGGEVARRLAEKLDELGTKVIDVVEKKNGVDILLEDRSAASRLLKELRKYVQVKVKYTGEDVGVTSTGKLRRRLVISVRLGR